MVNTGASLALSSAVASGNTAASGCERRRCAGGSWHADGGNLDDAHGCGSSTFSVRLTKFTHKGKKRVVKHTTTTYTYGTGSAKSSGKSTVPLTIALSGSAGRELKKLGRARVTIAVTFTPTGGKAKKETKTLTVKRSRKGKNK